MKKKKQNTCGMNEFQGWIFSSKKLQETENWGPPRGLSEALHWGATRSDIGAR